MAAATTKGITEEAIKVSRAAEETAEEVTTGIEVAAATRAFRQIARASNSEGEVTLEAADAGTVAVLAVVSPTNQLSWPTQDQARLAP